MKNHWVVVKFGGNAILTSETHETGTDRVFEVFKKNLNGTPRHPLYLPSSSELESFRD